MSLEPFEGKQRKVRFRTYDLEWYPGTMRLRVAGEFDGKRYWPHRSIEDFLNHALTHANSGTVWFAHAGGLADVQYVLETIATSRKYTAKVVLSGSAAIMVRVSRIMPDGTAGRDSWTFADSYWILRSPLSQIGAAIGIPKLNEWHCPGSSGHGNGIAGTCGHQEGHCIFHAPEAVLLPYNEQDCRILFVALERTQDTLLAMGGALKKTLASCAMHLFRSRYLHTSIPTLDAVNKQARKAYVASRVEVFRPKSGAANYYDVNSSFPHSMTAPQPGRLISVTDRLPDSGIFLASLTVSVPDSYIPSLPYRGDDRRIYFPTGQWHGWFTQSDVEYLLSKGGSIESVSEVLVFEPFNDLRQYALDLYERKAAAKDPFTRLLWKLLLNSLYGKFAEREEKRHIVLNPDESWFGWDSPDSVTFLSPGIFAVEEQSDIPHAHVPIAANITSMSRALLGRYLDQAAAMGDVFYADTDSVITTATLPCDDTALGELKLERSITDAEFLAPKLYRMHDAKGKAIVRAKGFRRLSDSDFDALKEGESVDVQRMLRVRENANSGDMSPKERTMKKRFVGSARPKRAPCGSNDTRPWTIKEIAR